MEGVGCRGLGSGFSGPGLTSALRCGFRASGAKEKGLDLGGKCRQDVKKEVRIMGSVWPKRKSGCRA